MTVSLLGIAMDRKYFPVSIHSTVLVTVRPSALILHRGLLLNVVVHCWCVGTL